MKKFIIFTLSLLTILAMAGCNKKVQEEQEPMTQIPNPFMEYASLDEAAKAVGFDFTIPEGLNGTAEYVYRVMNGEMMEIICRNAAGEEVARFRKAKGSDDISGDYNEYGDVRTDNSLKNITYRGENGMFTGAIWVDGEYTYALSLEEAMTLEQVGVIISQTH